MDFFKMLDEKIESGPDYDSAEDEAERRRLVSLLQEWESASRSTPPTPECSTSSTPRKTHANGEVRECLRTRSLSSGTVPESDVRTRQKSLDRRVYTGDMQPLFRKSRSPFTGLV